MQKTSRKKPVFKAQTQPRPGQEYKMIPAPEFDNGLPGNNLLLNKKCIITGGDSGIGRAVAVAFAKEGADVAIIYLNEKRDASETAIYIEQHFGKRCLLVESDIGSESNCKRAVKKVMSNFQEIDVLVNNAAVHFPQEKFEDITSRDLSRTFNVNILSMFWLTKLILPYMKEGSSIINSSSVTAYRGSGGLVDYSATKGAIVSFTRSLSANLVARKIRVNGVAPGPIWTPLVPSSFDPSHVKTYGTDVPMKRPGQPVEVAGCFTFLASDAASYMTGQFLHPNGGEIINC